MSGLKTGPASRGLQRFAVPTVCILIGFLAYFSQWLFNRSPDLTPGPLTSRQSLIFNALVACVWYTYYKACTVDPGRYAAPSSSSSEQTESKPGTIGPGPDAARTASSAPRWCKKCQAPKPLRAHHCRHCGRCIPKMDHHCPWTSNCVSMQTFPYFLRFLLYTNVALWTLAFFVFQRLSNIWSERNLPAYLGPSLAHLVSLTILSLVNFATSLALGVLLFTTVKGWVFNSTMIEDWEVERHEAVLARLEKETDDRSGSSGDFWGADGGSGVLLRHLNRIEFPYDLGLFFNMAQAMGTRNPLLWFFPLAGGPVINPSAPGKGPGWEWEENGFNDLPGLWPPADPEKLRRAQSGWPGAASRIAAEEREDPFYSASRHGKSQTLEEAKAAFASRQLADLHRRRRLQRSSLQGDVLAELEEIDDYEPRDRNGEGKGEGEWEGEPAWTNAEGDRLWDYGVDEDVDRDDDLVQAQRQTLIPLDGEEDDDVPIAELIRRRKVLTKE